MALGVLVFLSSSLMFLSSKCSAFLNIEELQNSKYGIEILNEPVLLKEVGLENIIQVSSVHGQKYQCDIPVFKEHEKVENNSQKNQDGKNATELLKSLHKKCLNYHKDWWTYEVCFGKHIMQYHEEDFRVVGEKIPLGYFNATATQAINTTKFIKPKTKKFLYHVDAFTNGSVCDLTGKPRKAHVRFQCSHDELEESIVSLSEPETCFYVITVATKLLCTIPAFSPPHPTTPKSITCSPALSQEQYDSYNNAFKEPGALEAGTQVGEVNSKRDSLSKNHNEETDVFGNFHGDQFRMTTSVKSDESSYITMIGRRLFKNMDKQIKKYESYLDKDKSQSEPVSQADKAWEEESKKFKEQLSLKFDVVSAKKMNMELLLKTKLELLGVDKLELEGIVNGDPMETDDDDMIEEEQEEEEEEEEVGEHHGRKLLKKINPPKVNQRKKVYNHIKELKSTARTMTDDEILPKGGKELKIVGEIQRLYKDKDYNAMMVWKREEELKNEIVKFISSIRKHAPELDKEAKNEKERKRSGESRERILAALQEVIDYLEKENNELKQEITAEEEFVKTVIKQLMHIARIMEDLEDPKKIRSSMEKCKTMIYHFTETRFKRLEDVEETISNIQKKRTKYKMKWLTELIGEDFVAERKKRKHAPVASYDSEPYEPDDHEEPEDIDDGGAGSRIAFGKYKVNKLVSRVKQMLSALSGTTDKTAKQEKGKTGTELSDGKDGSEAKQESNKKDFKNSVSVQIKKIKNLKGNQGWYGDNEENMDPETSDDEEDEEGIKSATKQMEGMIKQQLKDAGIVPSADIKVKIYTTRDPLSKAVDDPGGAQLLTEDETMQFKDLLMGLLGGGKASLKEKERQEKLKNNYNLVWGANGFQQVQTEDNNDEENKAGLIYRGV